jgi:hypothetical protein
MSNAYHDTDPADVLEAFESLLIASGHFTAANCWTAMERPDDPTQNAGTAKNLFAVIYPGEAQFSGPLFDGAGLACLTEDTTITVEIFSFVSLDSRRGDYKALRDSDRSVIKMAKKVIKAMGGKMLTYVYSAVTYDILRQPLVPVSRSAPNREDDNLTSLAVGFQALYDWDMS